MKTGQPEVVKKLTEYAQVETTLRILGYKVTKPKHKNCNGPDLFAIKDDFSNVLSVEIKSVYKRNNGNVFRVKGVNKPRQNDDLIAIVFPCGYVLVEPMRDHLKCCNKQGDRFISI